MHLLDEGGFFQLGFFVGAAIGLDLAELVERSFELAREAMLVRAEVRECAGVLAQGGGHGKRGVDFRMGRVDVVRLLVDAEREQVGFEGGDAIEAPGSVGERLHELIFEGALGLEVVEEAAGVAFVGSVVFGGQDDDVAGESMAEGVEGGTLFAGRGAGAGGVFGVGAIDAGASDGRGLAIVD